MKIMKHLPLLALPLVLASCQTVPITGRSQISLVPASQIQSMSAAQYGEFLKANKVSVDPQKTEMVKRVGVRIQHAVEGYFEQMGMSEELAGYRWEFNLVESPEVNAWCMPGGKVVVYSGILPVTKDEAGLAMVMGHEIAHAIAEHGSERLSQGLLVQAGGMGLTAALQKKPEETKSLWMSAYGLVTKTGLILPYSRMHESEADEMGLVFMALAGYDPREAAGFWERMGKAAAGKKPPEILSTHPSDETRIKKIRELIPGTMKYYRPLKP